MLKKNNDETILNEYVNYLMDKGKIIQIKDISKEINIRFSTGIIFYFLSIVSTLLTLLTVYLIRSFLINPNIDFYSDSIIIIGTALFTAIIIGVTLNEKKYIKLNITYPNEHQIKVNNKIFDIEKEDCYIDIIKKIQYNHGYYTSENTFVPSYYEAVWFLTIKGTRNSKSYKITNKTEKELKDFIYNFEYEFSSFKKKKSEFLKNATNTLEELYDNGNVSQETLNNLYNKKTDV